jgi:UTP--glucose-1-phosphate uridylyltransferase
MITKAIIPAAGLGTRLLPATKEQPKEMLPILVKDGSGTLYLKPFLQLVFEQLYGSGFRELCFIVGRGKRSIEDHFTVDDSFVDFLKSKNKTVYLDELSSFYEKVRHCTIAFANQPKPLGFADAVKRGRFFSGNENFLVHAGDDLVISRASYIDRLTSAFEKYQADATFFVQKVHDPRKYGVATGEEIRKGVYHLNRVVEKPNRSVSKLAIVAIYAFSARLFDAIENVQPGVNNELQLSDAIQILIEQTNAVYAVELNSRERRIEIGSPDSYREAFTARI